MPFFHSARNHNIPTNYNQNKNTSVHLHYNSHDPACTGIQALFKKHVLILQGRISLQDLNNRKGHTICANRIFVCYH